MPAELLVAVTRASWLPLLESILQSALPRLLALAPPHLQPLWEALESQRPQVLLLGVDRAGIDCTRILHQALGRYPALHVIVLSPKASGDEVRAALAAGASGYYCLGDDLEHLPGMIDAVRSGKVRLSPTAHRSLLQPAGAPAPEPQSGAALTTREHEVARLLTHGHSSREIAALLHISLRTVNSHRASIRNKLRGRSHPGSSRLDRGGHPED